jgi:pyridoxal phosphate enzyme (YggS family)
MAAGPVHWDRTLVENLARVAGRVERACRRSGRSPESVTLIAIVKYVEDRVVEALPEVGVRNIGESRVQDALARAPLVQGRAVLHMVGTLQTNKVNKALRLFDVIHSLDRLDLVEAIQKRAERSVDGFLQVNLTGDASRRGIPPERVEDTIRAVRECAPAIRLRGLMTIPPAGEDPRPHFRRLRDLALRTGIGELSMGMSGDFEVAIEEGATHVRIGSALWEGLPDALLRRRHAPAGH